MAAPSVTYTFTNATNADATEVNQNFSDIINALTDGTKDLTVNLLQANGAATFNGNVTLGNAAGDDITFTGRIATDLDPKNAATNTLGDATQTWQALYLDNTSTDGGAIYFDGGSTEFLKANAAGTQLDMGGFTYFNLPAGSSIKTFGMYLEAKSASYTITDTDGVNIVLMTTGASDRTVTLPTVADNTGRVIQVKKVDSGAGKVIIDGEGSETIDGSTTIDLYFENDFLTCISNGTEWKIVGFSNIPAGEVRVTRGNGHGSTNTKIRRFVNTVTNTGSSITYADSATNGGSFTINEDGIYTIAYTDTAGSTHQMGISVNSSQLTTDIAGITNADRVGYAVSDNANVVNGCAVSVRLSQGDVVRAHTNGVPSGTNDAAVYFHITQVAKLVNVN